MNGSDVTVECNRHSHYFATRWNILSIYFRKRLVENKTFCKLLLFLSLCFSVKILIIRLGSSYELKIGSLSIFLAISVSGNPP